MRVSCWLVDFLGHLVGHCEVQEGGLDVPDPAWPFSCSYDSIRSYITSEQGYWCLQMHVYSCVMCFMKTPVKYPAFPAETTVGRAALRNWIPPNTIFPSLHLLSQNKKVYNPTWQMFTCFIMCWKLRWMTGIIFLRVSVNNSSLWQSYTCLHYRPLQGLSCWSSLQAALTKRILLI